MSNFCKIGFTSVFLKNKNEPEIAILASKRALTAVMWVGVGELIVSLIDNVVRKVLRCSDLISSQLSSNTNVSTCTWKILSDLGNYIYALDIYRIS